MCEFEYENEKYPFLNVPKPEKIGMHYEVTKYSINTLYKYSYYGDKYNNTVVRAKAKPRMITMPGYSIQRKDAYTYNNQTYNSINLVCDVMTAPVAYNKETKVSKAFEILYHSIGNFLPIPEGANYGSYGGKADHHEHKLNEIKSLFEKSVILSDEDIYQINERINISFSLSSSARKKSIEKANSKYDLKLEPLTDKIQLRYWIQMEWKNNGLERKNKGLDWRDFVDFNYLQDFVGEDYKPLPLSKNPNETLKLIIKRGYRILNSGKEIPQETLEGALESIRLTIG